MGSEEPKDTSKEPETGLVETGQEEYVLQLYVAGKTPKSARAIANIKRICEKELAGRYDLEIIDIYQEPDRVKDEQLLAVPVLVRKLPAPLRRVIGDLSDTEKVLVGLDLRPKENTEHTEAD